MPATLSRTKRTVSLLVLGLIVMASATQTEVANYLGATKGYSKPYFTFFLTHSFFTILFPLHLLVLRVIRPKDSPRSLLERLRQVVAVQLKVDAEDARAVHQKVLAVVLKLTALISLPSICWYIAVPLTGTTDLTTIYATATFWTYGFSLLLLKTPLSRLVVASIFIAFSGVLLITYSGVAEAKHKHRHDSGQHKGEMETEPPHRMLGDLIMLVGAIVLGFYEVIYKKALPEGQGGMISGPVEGEDNPDGGLYQSVSNDDGGEPQRPVLPTHRRSLSNLSPRSSSDACPPDAPLDSGTRLNGTFKFAPPPVAKPKLPLALHANMLTSMIGVMTLCLFWIPIPLLHWIGWEPFELPWGSWGLMAIVCATGAIYNAGFMILIGLLGPTTASVANLLTIGLVAVTDAFYLGHTTPFWTLVGAGLVGAGFGTLLWAGEEDGH